MDRKPYFWFGEEGSGEAGEAGDSVIKQGREELTGVNFQEHTRDELMESLRVTLKEALELNKQEALSAAGAGFLEETIAV